MRRQLFGLACAASVVTAVGSAVAAPIPVDGAWIQKTQFQDAPVFFSSSWEFSCGPAGCTFDISGNRVISPRFEVYNFDALIGTTPVVPNWSDLGCISPFQASCRITDPDDAWNDPRYSKLSLFLAEGDYSITIRVLDIPPNAAGGRVVDSPVQFRVTAVPVPAALPLFVAGVAAIGLAARRHRR